MGLLSFMNVTDVMSRIIKSGKKDPNIQYYYSFGCAVTAWLLAWIGVVAAFFYKDVFPVGGSK